MNTVFDLSANKGPTTSAVPLTVRAPVPPGEKNFSVTELGLYLQFQLRCAFRIWFVEPHPEAKQPDVKGLSAEALAEQRLKIFHR